MNRDQICEEFGFDKVKNPKYDQYKMRTTIYDNLLKLFKKGLIDKNTRENGKRGRPPVFWNVKNASKNVSFN